MAIIKKNIDLCDIDKYWLKVKNTGKYDDYIFPRNNIFIGPTVDDITLASHATEEDSRNAHEEGDGEKGAHEDNSEEMQVEDAEEMQVEDPEEMQVEDPEKIQQENLFLCGVIKDRNSLQQQLLTLLKDPHLTVGVRDEFENITNKNEKNLYAICKEGMIQNLDRIPQKIKYFNMLHELNIMTAAVIEKIISEEFKGGNLYSDANREDRKNDGRKKHKGDSNVGRKKL